MNLLRRWIKGIVVKAIRENGRDMGGNLVSRTNALFTCDCGLTFNKILEFSDGTVVPGWLTTVFLDKEGALCGPNEGVTTWVKTANATYCQIGPYSSKKPMSLESIEPNTKS